MLGNAAFQLQNVPSPRRTHLQADPIVAVCTPFRVTELCSPGAGAAKSTKAGFAQKAWWTFLTRRDVSLMIHPDPQLDPVNTKMARGHRPLEI
jgi:hypothetical protein